jgi:hypothetical protein
MSYWAVDARKAMVSNGLGYGTGMERRSKFLLAVNDDQRQDLGSSVATYTDRLFKKTGRDSSNSNHAR